MYMIHSFVGEINNFIQQGRINEISIILHIVVQMLYYLFIHVICVHSYHISNS